MSRLRRRRLALMRDAVFKGRIKAVSGYPVSLSRAVSLYSAEISGNSVQNGTPSPTAPIEIQSVGEKTENGYKIPLRFKGRNLFNPNDDDIVLHGRIAGGGNSIYRDDSYAKARFVSGYIPVKPGSVYSLNARSDAPDPAYDRFVVYGSDKSAVRLYTSNFDGFTVPADGCYLRFTGLIDKLDKIIVQEGAVTADNVVYEPYINDVFDIYLDEPLRKIGSYTDSISVDFERKSAEVVRNVKTLVLSGKENWTAFAAYSDRVKAYLNGYSQMAGCKSTHFVYAGAQTSSSIKGGEFSINAATFNLALPIALAATLDEMKTWLGENKPEFYIGQTAKSYDVSSMQKWEAAPSFGRFDVSLSADTAVSPSFDEVRYWCEG